MRTGGAGAAERNALIDGWRGISVLMVIVGHLFNFRVNNVVNFDALDAPGLLFGTKAFAIVSSLGNLGVCFFFMISGYLITTLLVSEELDRGRVSLKAFYVRRIFRIMPAFYGYVIIVYMLGRSGLIIIEDEAVLRSSLFLCNFSGFSCSWWLAHTWSLAVEEQFYLFWPMLFAFAARSRRSVAIGLLVSLFVVSLMVPPLGSFIYIMIGVIVALEAGVRERLTGLAQRYIWLAAALILVLPAGPRMTTAVLAPAQPLLVAIVLFGTLFGSPSGVMQRALRIRYLSRIGLISYSLYLWQQLSLAPDNWGQGPTGAGALYGRADVALAFAFIPLALASYILIEKPLIAVGHRISRRMKERGL